MHGLNVMVCVSPFDICNTREGTKHSVWSLEAHQACRLGAQHLEAQVHWTLSSPLGNLSFSRETHSQAPGSQERGRNLSCLASSFSQGKVTGPSVSLGILLGQGQHRTGSSVDGFQSSDGPTRAPVQASRFISPTGSCGTSGHRSPGL